MVCLDRGKSSTADPGQVPGQPSPLVQLRGLSTVHVQLRCCALSASLSSRIVGADGAVVRSDLKRGRRKMTRNPKSHGRLRMTTMVVLLALISLPAPARADVVTDWNLTMLQAAAAAGLNPQRQHRVAAMVHVAVHDAVNSIRPRYEAYAVHAPLAAHASIEAAVIQAAYGVL